jgi:hypothetical protein
MTLPRLQRIFHPKNISGKSLYLRGIPLSPKKCIGKKVIFTPRNIIQKTEIEPILLRLEPKKIGAQRVKPQRIPKTAPKEST